MPLTIVANASPGRRSLMGQLLASLVARRGIAVPSTVTCDQFVDALSDLLRRTGCGSRPFASIEFGTGEGNGCLTLDTDEYGAVEIREGRR